MIGVLIEPFWLVNGKYSWYSWIGPVWNTICRFQCCMPHAFLYNHLDRSRRRSWNTRTCCRAWISARLLSLGILACTGDNTRNRRQSCCFGRCAEPQLPSSPGSWNRTFSCWSLHLWMWHDINIMFKCNFKIKAITWIDMKLFKVGWPSKNWMTTKLKFWQKLHSWIQIGTFIIKLTRQINPEVPDQRRQGWFVEVSSFRARCINGHRSLIRLHIVIFMSRLGQYLTRLQTSSQKFKVTILF